MARSLTATFSTTAGLPGEVLLIAAILRQVVADAHSPSPAVQDEARAFLADAERVRFWCDLSGLDAAAFAQRVAAVLRRRGTD